eukprot:7047862-Karenia_brevis.AAC.1
MAAAINASEEELLNREKKEEESDEDVKRAVEEFLASAPQDYALTDNDERASSLGNTASSAGHDSHFGLSLEQILVAEAATPR